MNDLDSLLDQSNSSSLNDLVIQERPTDKPIINNNTAINLAAHTALLSDGPIETFQTIRKELSLNSGSITLDGVLAQANSREDSLSKAAMIDVLSDETISLDKKVDYASQWRLGDPTVPLVERSPEELLGINSLEKEGNVTDNREVDDTRWDLAPYLRQVDEYNDEVQKLINDAGIVNNPGALEGATNLLETVIPFLEGAAVSEVQTSLRNYKKQGDLSKADGIVKSLVLLGESKEEIRKAISNVPIDKRLDMAKAVYNMVIESDGTVLKGKNSMIIMDSLRNYLVEGQYTTGDRVLDDISSILDMFGVGATLRSGASAFKSAANGARFTRRIPKSVGETLANTNAKSHNAVLKLAADDETGEMAKTVFNSSREDAVVNAVGPEISIAEDAVRNKPIVDDAEFNPDMAVVEAIAGSKGSIQFSEAEKASKLQKVNEDFLNPDVTGVVAHKEMTTVKAVDEGVNIRTIYGPAEGGFASGKIAMEQVRLATRKYGVADEELTLMRRTKDGTYKPVDVNSPQANLKGNYTVGINHTSRYDPSDSIAWGVTDVKGSVAGIPLNLFDKFPAYLKGKGGSITQHLIPPSSYIDPLLTRSASVAVDQSARGVDQLIKIADEYASSYKKLPQLDKKKVDNYLVQANHDSLKFNPEKLVADGYSGDTIETLRAWKKTNDTLYVLENIDLVRQSKRKGYELFASRNGQDNFLVRPMNNVKAGSVEQVYDAELGTIRFIDKKEKTDLYAGRGYIASTRTPIQVGEETIGHVIVKNDSSNYARALRENDKLLNYRDGHFTIYYKDPVFITQVVKNADGSEYTKAIATAGTIQDADRHIERLRAANPDGVFDRRPNVKGGEFDEMNWNVNVNTGRTAQRTRGKTLADSTDRPTDMEFRHIETPEDSILRSINSIAARVNMKEFLDTSKARFMEQYKEFLPTDPDTFAKYWPDDITQLVRPQGQKANLGDYTDAISTYRYIDQMENGFVNLLDDVSKNFFKQMSDTAGRKGWGYLETGLRAGGDVSPTAFARKKAFRLLLAANPLRQLPVQLSQALPVVLATNPGFVKRLVWQGIFLRDLDRGGDVESFMKGLGTKLTGITPAEAHDLQKAYEASGIRSAVSAHSLIRDDLKSLVNRGVLKKTGAAIGKPIDVAQKYGFELGENMLMKTIWLSEYDLLRKSGKPINAESLAMLHARVRDLTLNMNKAGELAYNENMFSAAMQFLQAPHKAFAQIVFGNRALSRKDRLVLGTSYLATYGTGYGLLYSQASKLIDPADRELQDIVSGGLFNLVMNKTLGTIYGEPVNVDFSSSMRLLEVPNLYTMWETMATMNMNEILKNSPSLSMVAGDNGKFGNLFRSLGRLYTVPEDDGGLKDVGVNFLNLFSGASNFLKARYIIKRGYSISTKGEVVDSEVNDVEAMMRVAGFATTDEMLAYTLNDKTYYASKAFKDDVKKLMDETTKRLARDGISEQEMDYSLRMMQEATRVYGDNPHAMQVLQGEISRRAKTGDFVILNRLIEMAKFATEAEMREAIIRSNTSSEDRKKLFEIIDFMKQDEE